MKPIRVNKADQRALYYESDPDALDEFRALAGEMLERDLRMARLLLRIHLRSAFVGAKCSSIEDLAGRFRLDALRARDLLRLGYALAGHPDIEDWLRQGELSFAQAFVLGDLYQAEANPELGPVFDPDDLKDEDRWLHSGRVQRIGTFRKKVREHIASLREEGEKTQTWSTPLTEDVKDKLDRAREIANQKTDQKLTNAQLMNLIITSFLLDCEPRWAESRERRMPDTNERPDERGIPEAVKQEIWDRSDGTCEFGGCEEPYAQHCHLKPHAEGSGREVGDLVHGCKIHHKLYDAGLIRFLGWTEDGRPLFYDDENREMLRPKPLPDERDSAAVPPWMLKALSKRLRRKYERLKKVWDAKRQPEERPPSTGMVRERPPPYSVSRNLFPETCFPKPRSPI